MVAMAKAATYCHFTHQTLRIYKQVQEGTFPIILT